MTGCEWKIASSLWTLFYIFITIVGVLYSYISLLFQLPLPKHIDEQKVFNSVLRTKDVDGFSASNFGLFSLNMCALAPATPLAVHELILRTGKNADLSVFSDFFFFLFFFFLTCCSNFYSEFVIFIFVSFSHMYLS